MVLGGVGTKDDTTDSTKRAKWCMALELVPGALSGKAGTIDIQLAFGFWLTISRIILYYPPKKAFKVFY